MHTLALAELEARGTRRTAVALKLLEIAEGRQLVARHEAARLLMTPGVCPMEVHGLLLAWSYGNDPDTEYIRVRVAETALESLNRKVNSFA